MNDEKLNYVIDMIKDMDLENKLRLAICMCDNYSHTNLEYDKKEMCKYFDNLLKEINIEYRTTTINFANYPYTIFVSSKIMEMVDLCQVFRHIFLFMKNIPFQYVLRYIRLAEPHVMIECHNI